MPYSGDRALAHDRDDDGGDGASDRGRLTFCKTTQKPQNFS